MENKSKNLVLQELRAICIIAVILIHLSPGTAESDSLNYWLAFRKLINFPVAIFIFLSGYFIKLDDANSNMLQFYKKRLVRLLIPFLIWSTIYSLPTFMNYDSLTLKKAVMALLGDSAAHLYFILVLLQLIILTPLIAKIILNKNKFGLYALYSITPIFLVLLYYYNITTNSILPRYHQFFMAWIIFYVLGIAYRNNLIKINLSYISKYALILLMAILSLAEMNFLNSLGLPSGFTSSQITVTSFLYSIAILLLLVDSKTKDVTNKFLVKVGDISFGIYFIHVYILVILRSLTNLIFPKATTFIEFFAHQIGLGILTFLISYFIIQLGVKILNEKWVQYLGIK